MNNINSSATTLDTEVDNNDPNLCFFCDNQSKWPKCMSEVKLRGYHSVFKETCMDDVVSCKNHTYTCQDQ